MFHLVYYASSFNFLLVWRVSHWRSLGRWVTVPGSLEESCVHNLAVSLWIISKVLICFMLCGYSSIGRTRVV